MNLTASERAYETRPPTPRERLRFRVVAQVSRKCAVRATHSLSARGQALGEDRAAWAKVIRAARRS